MTEQKWFTCDNSAMMIEFVRPKASRRKLQLFAAASFRRLKNLLPDDRQFQAVEMLEEMPEDVHIRRSVVGGVRHALPANLNSQTTTTDDPYFVGLMLYRELVSRSTAHHASLATAGLPKGAEEEHEQSRLLRCIFGPLPFRHVPFDSDWRTLTVKQLAETIYEEKAFDRLPILADALQDAGCDSEAILNHCRRSGVHVRGCWVVDAVLDKK